METLPFDLRNKPKEFGCVWTVNTSSLFKKRAFPEANIEINQLNIWHLKNHELKFWHCFMYLKGLPK